MEIKVLHKGVLKTFRPKNIPCDHKNIKNIDFDGVGNGDEGKDGDNTDVDIDSEYKVSIKCLDCKNKKGKVYGILYKSQFKDIPCIENMEHNFNCKGSNKDSFKLIKNGDGFDGSLLLECEICHSTYLERDSFEAKDIMGEGEWK